MQIPRPLPLLAALLLCVPVLARAQAGDDSLQKPAKTATVPQDLRPVAERIRNDLRTIDMAVDMWSIENNRAEGGLVAIKELGRYFKPGSPLEKAAGNGQFTDALGNPITIGPIGTPISVSRKTVDQLSAVAPVEFWKPFAVK